MSEQAEQAGQAEQGDELLTVDEVAARLRVSAETVRRWLRAGELRGVRLSRRAGWRIEAAELRRFLARHQGDGENAGGVGVAAA